MVRHTETLPFKCTQCEMSFRRAYDLNCHRKCHEENPGETITKRPYICTECSKAFFKPHHLKEHKTIHSKEMPFSCNICPKSFRLKSFLKSHSKCHGNVPTCPQCGKTFSHTKYIAYHMVQQCKEAILQAGVVKEEKIKAATLNKNSGLFSHEFIVRLENQQLQLPAKNKKGGKGD